MPYTVRCKLVGILASSMAAAKLGLAASAKTPVKNAPTSRTQAPPVTNLYPSGTIEFSAPPPVAVARGTLCDTNGNIFLQYYPSVRVVNHMMLVPRSVEALPLRKLAVDSQQTVTFPVGPFQGYTKSSVHGFYVTPNGAVYNLAQACRKGQDPEGHETCAWLVTKYRHDGSVDSTVRLHLPHGANLLSPQFAAFPDGNLLVTGFSMSEKRGMRPFAAIFDPSGDFLTNLTMSRDAAPASAPTKAKMNSRSKATASSSAAKARRDWARLFRAIAGMRMVGAPDGAIYLLGSGFPERVYVASSGGKVLREQTITPPREGLSPFNMSVTGQGDLFVFYSHLPMPMDTSQYRVLALVDPQTGKVISTYDLPPKGGVPACMTSEGVILFTHESKSGHLAVAEYTPE